MKNFYAKSFSVFLLVLFTAQVAVAQQLVTQTFTYTGTIESFTIPPICNGVVTIQAVGASGGNATVNCVCDGGKGASMQGEFTLSAGTVLRILAGQEGMSNGADGSGGGGSFVALAQGTVPLIVAGGGGGASNNIGNCGANIHGMDAPITPSGTASRNGAGPGGTNGNGGQVTGNSVNSGGAGGGFYGDGAGGGSNPNGGGKAFVNGGAGGTPNTVSMQGGFGGGGCSWSTGGGGGGGGGYSGGGSDQISPYSAGGAGGSYNSGSNQVNVPGANTGHGYVVISYQLSTPVQVVASSPSICAGESVNLTATGTGIVSYTWNTNSNSSSINVSPTVSTVYTLQSTDQSGCVGTELVPITVHPLPNIAGVVTPTMLCRGSDATITVSGASSYTFDNGPIANEYIVNLYNTTTYSVSGTSPQGCVGGQTIEVLVNTNTLVVSPDMSVCVGKSATLQATGAVTYSWNTPSPFATHVVNPVNTTTYIVNATDAENCLLSNTVVVTVLPKPLVTLQANKQTVCEGEKVLLTAGGGSTYVFSSNVDATGNSGFAIPKINVPHTFTVSGTNEAGCTSTAAIVVNVVRCTGINEYQGVLASIFPNPNDGKFTVVLDKVMNNDLLETYDLNGKKISQQPAAEKNEIDLSKQEEGFYLVYLRRNDERIEISKVLVQKQ